MKRTTRTLAIGQAGSGILPSLCPTTVRCRNASQPMLSLNGQQLFTSHASTGDKSHSNKQEVGIEPWPVSVHREVEWSDMDTFNHVNNVSYLRWFEIVRIEHARRLGLPVVPAEVGLILAEVNCRYLLPLTFPDNVELATRTVSLGNTSWNVEYRVVSKQHKAAAALGTGRLVFFDYTKSQKVSIPQHVRQKISELEGKIF
jgi:acyl-CoA thioester hydrolase